MPLYILILVFLAIFSLGTSLLNIIFKKKIRLKERLESTASIYGESSKKETTFKEEITSFVESVALKFPGEKFVKKTKKKLSQAYVHIRVGEYLGLSLLLGLFFFLILFLLSRMWLFSFVGFLLGFILPDIFLNKIKNDKKKKINEQLPEALSILSNGLRAGFSFNQSMAIVAKEIQSPIKEEFSKIVRDNSLGMTLEQSLDDFAKRNDDKDIDMLVSALIIQKKVGGNLAELLDNIVETVRDRVRIRGELRTITAQGRMSAIVVSLLPFGVAIMLLIVSPDYIMALFRNPIGIAMVVIALALQAVGMFIIMKIASVEV